MNSYDIYRQIAERTQGNIYIGVVGPARTGTSTFIKKFTELLVPPNMETEYVRDRTRDELPQSSAGRTIMTVEPKFIPEEAVEVTVGDNVRFKVRLVDCVGYMVRGAIGHYENDMPRMVTTPWFEHQVPFSEAAEYGTRKVITDHSTVGLLVTTDGTITDLDREEYVDSERKVANELKSLNKPFIVLLNSARPYEPEAMRLRDELEDNYSVPVILTDFAQMRIDDLNDIMEKVLLEFPVREIGVGLPAWVDALDEDHWLMKDLVGAVRETCGKVKNMRQARDAAGQFGKYDFIANASAENIDPGEGSVFVDLSMADGLFYRVLSEEAGVNIDGDHMLISMIKDLSRIKKEYDRMETALNDVRTKGYGMVMPVMDELSLEEPEIIKHGNRFGVRLRASAPSIHMIMTNIESELAPLVGTEKQSEELVTYLLREFENEPAKIWESNIFGKSLHELVSEDLHNKLTKMPEDAQLKLQETLQRIINEGSGGLICIIL